MSVQASYRARCVYHIHWLLLIVIGATLLPAAVAQAGVAAYIDPTLVTVPGEPAGAEVADNQGWVRVIVTAHSTALAQAAVLHNGGTIVADLHLIDSVGALLPQAQVSRLATHPDVIAIVRDGTVQPAAYAKPTSDPMVWEVESPVSVAVGATQLHGATRQTTENISGKGVTIAIIDTGIAFDERAVAVLGTGLRTQFKGQADFVGTGHCQGIGEARDGYCWSSNQGWDGYGHGTHIAGTIWNHFLVAGQQDDWGVAPEANLLSVRVLDNEGRGSYTDVIQGIQFAVDHKDEFNIRIINLSLLAYANTPYFIDPVNRAVEKAWQRGLVVMVAGGNNGPGAETVTVPGNDPYVITVGAYDTNSTASAWEDDTLSTWSSTGPTRDGFIKPDVLAPGANVVAYMYTDPQDRNRSAALVRLHPDYDPALTLYRLNGTSMATGVASGVVALMLQKHVSDNVVLNSNG